MDLTNLENFWKNSLEKRQTRLILKEIQNDGMEIVEEISDISRTPPRTDGVSCDQIIIGCTKLRFMCNR